MKKEIAEILMNEIKQHEGIKLNDERTVLETLLNTDVPESSRFYERIKNNEDWLDEPESSRYSVFSLRRIIRNENVAKYEMNFLKRCLQGAFIFFNAYSSDDLCRRLRTDKQIVEMIRESKIPYSLLAKKKSLSYRLDYEEGDRKVYIETKPILIIPGAKFKKLIYDWENKNTIYEKELGSLFLRVPVKTTRNEYNKNVIS